MWRIPNLVWRIPNPDMEILQARMEIFQHSVENPHHIYGDSYMFSIFQRFTCELLPLCTIDSNASISTFHLIIQYRHSTHLAPTSFQWQLNWRGRQITISNLSQPIFIFCKSLLICILNMILLSQFHFFNGH